MTANKQEPTCKTVRKWMLSAIPFMFILGSATHFAYEWSGNNPIVGIFCPVNESVWEHLKMSFWVPLFWWIIKFFRTSKKYGISQASWFASAAVSLYAAALFVASFFYTYTGAFGIELVIVDILSLLAGITIAQITAFHIYKYGNFKGRCFCYSLIAIGILALAFAVFTFLPPHLPLFMDSNTGKYGIH